MQNEAGTQGASGGGTPRWGQLQHQFCRPEELAASASQVESSPPDPVGWPGDPPSVTIHIAATDPMAGGTVNQAAP